MQRKNYILIHSRFQKNPSRKRGGFAIIMAISVIVVIATIMALSLSLTTQTSKQTTDLYLYEQAVLLSKSATEYALLEISQNNCIDNLNFTEDIYNINIDMHYVYSGALPATCTNSYFTITTPESSGSVLMDVTVSTNAASEPITFFRRSIQKL
ncbi:hypothetical protein KKG72_09910 [bacterium]|nr:hypothetical protein [bacterium]MBU1995369.1 hypothetical protein [bacterium]